MTTALLVLATIALVAVSGFAAATESAISSMSTSDLEHLADESRPTKALRQIAAEPSAHLNALTFIRVLFETSTAVIVTLLLDSMFGEHWQVFLIAVAIMIVVSFLVTGASPRSVGRVHAAAVLRVAAVPTRVCRILVGPVAGLLVKMGNRITPGRPRRAGALLNEDQFLSMVDEAAEHEVLEEEDRTLIHSVIDFSDTLVREVMVARTDMFTVDDDATVREAVEALLEAGYSRAPVTGRDSDDVRGIVYMKDLTRALLSQQAGSTRAVTVARTAPLVPESLGADDLLRRMQTNARHVAMVVDEYGGIAGLVTLEDLVEELVGEIADEYDRPEHRVERLPDGRYRVPSRLALSDLGEVLERDIEDDDVDSVGGLLAKGLEKIPEVGDVTVIAALELEAERAGKRRRIETVLVRVLEPDEAGDLAETPNDDITDVLAKRRESERMARGDEEDGRGGASDADATE